jgi:hypothetical protein
MYSYSAIPLYSPLKTAVVLRDGMMKNATGREGFPPYFPLLLVLSLFYSFLLLLLFKL